MSVKIAIVTLYYRNANYGGLLQSYALQNKLGIMGYDAKQIRYDLNSGYETTKKKASLMDKTVFFFNRIKNYRWRQQYKKYAKRLQVFEESIPHTQTVNAESIKSLIDDFDIFVCGSDQIWNPIGWQPTLFLDFLPDEKYRFSYAASIARDELTKSEIDYVSQFIKKFDSVSVREKKSAAILRESIPDLQVEVMPDPTLLLYEQEWKYLPIPAAEKILKQEKPYIFAYFLGTNLQQRNKCIEFADSRGLNIFFIPYMNKTSFKWDNKHKKYILNNVGVEKFLSLIKNAELVLTDSYHGTVFSAIFHKAFFVFNRFADNDRKSMNSRIVTLLEELGIVNRFITSVKEIVVYQLSSDEIVKIHKNLKRLNATGTQYLKRVINTYQEK